MVHWWNDSDWANSSTLGGGGALSLSLATVSTTNIRRTDPAQLWASAATGSLSCAWRVLDCLGILYELKDALCGDETCLFVCD